ncbi:hypothetical protein ARMGADRAFT_926418 [Armillaria gallica]|uniref:Uncharacterized protein n=1 Tax=Armillaria gallica TaxID=47427 RepID=A0A2H3DWB1_ARMGA|nr:hypothetical protein ARMGADRAFT_926418 [Armillaria gallica]
MRINYPYLTDYFNYKAWDIAMLTDDSPDPCQRLTRKNIINTMKWLVNDAQLGDTSRGYRNVGPVHWAGSGRQVYSEGGNKGDGYEEAILPVNYDQHGDILHEEMYNTMIRPLPMGCRLMVCNFLIAFLFKCIDKSLFTRFYFQ